MIKRIPVFILIFIFLFVVSCVTVPEGSTDNEAVQPEEYTEDEFPSWLVDLRRAEIIFAGSIPITLLVSGMGYGLYSIISSGTGGSSSIEDFTDTVSRTNEERYRILSISIGLSGMISLADFILGLVEDSDEDG